MIIKKKNSTSTGLSSSSPHKHRQMDFADNFQNRFHFKELHTIDKITSIERPKKVIEILITKLLVKTLVVFLLSREYFVVRKKKMRIAKNTMDISPAANSQS